MIEEYQLRVLPQVAATESLLKDYLQKEKGIDARSVRHIRTLKRSIDARQRTIFVNLKVRVYINEEPTDDAFTPTEYRDVSDAPQVIVVGAGPGGLFAALRTARATTVLAREVRVPIATENFTPAAKSAAPPTKF